jgi:hypothetical protein
MTRADIDGAQHILQNRAWKGLESLTLKAGADILEYHGFTAEITGI